MKTPKDWIAENGTELTESVVLKIQDDTLYHAVELIRKHGVTGPNGGLAEILKAKIALPAHN